MEFEWVFAFGGLSAFIFAFGNSANDVGNSWSAAIGAKAVTMKQAVLLAVICEAVGAQFLATHSTSTLRGIAKDSCFATAQQQDVLMYGLACSIFCAGLWVMLSTALWLPVSSSHALVGSLIGMTLALGGIDCVIWYQPATNSIPKFSGVAAILLSWVVSPIFAAVCGAAVFAAVRLCVLRRKNSFLVSSNPISQNFSSSAFYGR
jgi:solute carrier family 20 (sodium-dependent phosphate transporter)